MASGWGKVRAKQHQVAVTNFWSELYTDDGDVYYYNTKTQETTWERPPEMDVQTESPRAASKQGAKGSSSAASDLRSLAKLRDKKNYDHRSDDHTRAKKAAAAVLGQEKVVFSDHAYRIVPPDKRSDVQETVIQPAILVVTTRAVYDFEIGYGKPLRRLPLRIITRLGVHERIGLIYFRLRGERKSQAIRYFNPRKDHIVSIMLRTYAQTLKLGLKKAFFKVDPPAAIVGLHRSAKVADSKGGLFGLANQVQAVAAFRGGLVKGNAKKCNYCGLPVSGSDVRRHGEYVYHLECDPRERARFREQANKAIAAGEQKITEKVTGALAEKRAAQRAARLKAQEDQRREVERRIAEVEADEVRKKQEHEQEIERRRAEHERMREAYDERKRQVANAYTCGGCHRSFTGGDYYSALGHLWHPECFTCADCGCSFGEYGYFIRDNRPYCRQHAEKTKFGKLTMWLGDVAERWRDKALRRQPKKTAWTKMEGAGAGARLKYYWLTHDNELKGPLTASEMLHLRDAGRIDRGTYCIREDDDDYVQLSDIEAELQAGGRSKKRKSRRPTSVARVTGGKQDNIVTSNDSFPEWYYCNAETNELEGPFTASQLNEWYESGHLSRDIHVIRAGEQDYHPIHRRAQTIMNAASFSAVNPMNAASASAAAGNKEIELSVNPMRKNQQQQKKKKKKKRGGRRSVTFGASAAKFAVGDRVEAPYGGSARYPAVVDEVRADGTYVVTFDGYGNQETFEEARLHHPSDDPTHSRNQTIIPDGWQRHTTEEGQKYYMNPEGETQWDKPPGN